MTYEYIQCSFSYFRDVRERCQRRITLLEQSGVKKVVIFGIGELAEFAYISVQESELTLVGFIASQSGLRFLSFSCITPDLLQDLDFDAVLISDLSDIVGARTQLRGLGVPDNKIFALV